MTTIYLSYEDAKHEDAVARLLESEAKYSPNWNGAEFRIDVDDYTWIDDESYAGAILLEDVRRVCGS